MTVPRFDEQHDMSICVIRYVPYTVKGFGRTFKGFPTRNVCIYTNADDSETLKIGQKGILIIYTH